MNDLDFDSGSMEGKSNARGPRCVSFFVVFCVFSWPSSAWSSPFSFDDIDFWVGSGANRAAMVSDWVRDSDEVPALAWGYRWDGAASGRDMLLAIVAADDRLFAKLDKASDPTRLYALGYDADDDGQFGATSTTFDGEGFAYTASPPFFGATRTDPEDYYAEGWTFNFWHYGVSNSNPYAGGAWTDVQYGMKDRPLVDGAWDSWTLEDTTPPFTAYATNPVAAQPPGGEPGDFNNDGHVDVGDYEQWRREFGSSSPPATSDGDHNGIVDTADYVLWRKFASLAGGGGSETQNVPECCTAYLSIAWIVLSGYRKRNTNQR
jgi:hypothetical protein